MLAMSHSVASEQGSGGGGWKESYRSTAESVESFEDSVDSDNSSSSHASGSRSQSGANLQPIGCITTHSVSSVIRPEKKMPLIDPLQFVKIQKNELSKKAAEQIKLAEEVKITKEKIKEVEEEWQNNLMSWKSKRKLTKNNSEDESVLSRNTNRKTKTFSEILNEKARSGGRIGYNLHRYADVEVDEEPLNFDNKDFVGQYETTTEREYNSPTQEENNMANDQFVTSQSNNHFDATESNLNRLLKSNSTEHYAEDEIVRQNFGDVVVFNTTLLEEFSVKSDSCDVVTSGSSAGYDAGTNNTNGSSDTLTHEESATGQQQQQQQLTHVIEEIPAERKEIDTVSQIQPEPSQLQAQSYDALSSSVSNQNVSASHQQHVIPQKVHVPINDWKSSQNKSPKQSVPSSDDDTAIQPHNSSFEVEDEEDELEDELERRLRLDQERSFKAKLYAFENLAKQEEEAARKAAESYRRRQQTRQAKLAAERSKSLGNIQQSSSSSSSSARPKAPVSNSHSISSSSISATSQSTFSSESVANAPSTSHSTKSQMEKQSKSLQNLNSSEYHLSSMHNTTSTIYNFTDKAQQRSQELDSLSLKSEQSESKSTTNSYSSASAVQQNNSKTPKLGADTISKSSSQSTVASSQQNIYENITPMGLPHQPPVQLQQHQSVSPIDPVVSDTTAIRNASQKLLQQQQQIYQNQPLPSHYQQPQQQQQQQLYSQDHYKVTQPTVNNYGFMPPDHPIQPTDSILNDKVINPVPIRGGYSTTNTISDEVGLPPIQITKSIQSGAPIKSYNQMASKQQLPEEEHLYQNVNQNQMMLGSGGGGGGPSQTQVYSAYDYPNPNPAIFEGYNNSNVHYPEPNYENKALIQKRMEDSANGIGYPMDQYPQQPVHPYSNTAQPNQFLYYPKPYSANNSSQQVKPIGKQPAMNVPRAVLISQNNARYNGPSNGHPQQQQPLVAYNQNHWLLQEAELRRQLDSMESSSTRLKNPNVMLPQPPPQQLQAKGSSNPLSVSGKKKCSSCHDELGKGCAAMVVESLSLYYHINCFRCSVCATQLGNGTVGTDVRVRNNKLHCQNCYSNDEAGLKFSRV